MLRICLIFYCPCFAGLSFEYDVQSCEVATSLCQSNLYMLLYLDCLCAVPCSKYVLQGCRCAFWCWQSCPSLGLRLLPLPSPSLPLPAVKSVGCDVCSEVSPLALVVRLLWPACGCCPPLTCCPSAAAPCCCFWCWQSCPSLGLRLLWVVLLPVGRRPLPCWVV